MWNPLSGSPGSLIRYNLLSCLPPLADLTRQSTLPSRRRLLLPSFRPSRLPFSPSDISTVASGHLHRQDSHLLEQQLASLHERTGFELPRPLSSRLLIFTAARVPATIIMFPKGAGKSLSRTPALAEFQVRPDNPTTASVLIRRVQTSGGSNQGIERFAFAVTLADLKCRCCLEGVQRLWSSTFSRRSSRNC